MELNPYLSFNGDCETAFKFYEKHLGGKILAIMKYADSPACDETRPEDLGLVMHACMEIGPYHLMGSDSPSAFPYEPIRGTQVAIHTEDPADADRLFNVLSEGGSVQMPIQETFWAKRFGMATDRFGVPWIINCNKPDALPQASERAA